MPDDDNTRNLWEIAAGAVSGLLAGIFGLFDQLFALGGESLCHDEEKTQNGIETGPGTTTIHGGEWSHDGEKTQDGIETGRADRFVGDDRLVTTGRKPRTGLKLHIPILRPR